MPQPPQNALLDAILPHVVFDGWGQASFDMAVADLGIEPVAAQAICPRGALDLAVALHRRGDAAMLEKCAQTDLSQLRYRDKVAALVKMRLEVIEDREVVRKACALFALPQHLAEGSALIWDTADAIWTALGDHSDDINWYSKRATLSAVYSSTVLFWLGDDSEGYRDTWAFLERRIDNVMQIETLKAGFRKSPVLQGLFAGPIWALGKVRAPKGATPAPDQGEQP
ncbi:MAG: COQ9 family protein [Rhodobacterales bacterium]|nr:MAG: COQ9 family protein [Rhodobacterales bacterium]